MRLFLCKILKNPFHPINLQKAKETMPEEIINKYRLTSMEEPTDEMMAQIMHEVAAEAKKGTDTARQKYFEDLRNAIKKGK